MLDECDLFYEWHQPLNPKKNELVFYHKSVQYPKLDISYDGMKIVQKKNFKYLGFIIDTKPSFRIMIDTLFIKLRRAYAILTYIHRPFFIFKIKNEVL